MKDETEGIRKLLVGQINLNPGSREALEAKYGQVWDTTELQRDFNVVGFLAPYVAVVRRADNQKGVLTFQANPRFYFEFTEG